MTSRFPDRAVCVSLARRGDRWQQFLDGLPSDWPFPPVERYVAVDGQLCPPPQWWKQGGGAWGCYRSHLRIIEECLRDGVESALLLEDDAVFPADFAERWRAIEAELPADCGVLYLGGQHLMQQRQAPTKVSKSLVRPYNVNRTHAWALIGQQTMRDVYQHLCSTKEWRSGHHIDHHMGLLHMSRKVPVYAPVEWIVGQRADKSDVSGRDVPTRFWGGVTKQRLAIVMGLHRSGSSCLAGVIAKLGVHFGKRFVGCEEDGGHESWDLAGVCEQAMPFPSIGLRVAGLDRKLKAVLDRRRIESQGPIGIKYPHLCAMGAQLTKIVGADLKPMLVVADRDVEASIASLVRRCPKRAPQRLAQVQRFLLQHKESFLKTTKWPALRVSYEAMLADPEAQTRRVAEFLGLEPIESAWMYVRTPVNA